jgi:hypothetical protein
MATGMQDVQIARQSCRKLYHDYIGRKPGTGTIARFERLLLAEAAASQCNPEEKKMAVRSYFADGRDRLWVLLEEVDKARSVDGLIDIGLGMQSVLRSLGDVQLKHTHDAELFSFLRAAEIVPARGSPQAMLFRGILHEDSRLVARTGIEDLGSGVPVNLLRGNGNEETVGRLSVQQKPVGAKTGGWETADDEAPRTMAMKVSLIGSQVADPQGAIYNLFYIAQQDYSKAIYRAEKFVYGLAHNKAEAARVMSSPAFSFMLRTPSAGEEPKIHLEGRVSFRLDNEITYSLSVTLPGSRLHAHCSSSNGSGQRWELVDFSSNNVGC